MTIAHKLMVIVLLTILEVGITIWGAFQISKGATFHQLNSLHLKYNAQFLEKVRWLETGVPPDLTALQTTIELIRQQPIDCLTQSGVIDRVIMRLIGTDYALDLCHKDISDANRALTSLELYRDGRLSQPDLVYALRQASQQFVENSTAFEAPVTATVEFIFRTMIPMIIFISLFNISFITYLSRTISGSIRQTITMLSNSSEQQSLDKQLEVSVTGELRELLHIAQERIEKDFLNFEKNEKLKALVDKRTASLLEANEELEHFSYRSSHDLKGPLTRSKRMCQFILRDIQDGKIDVACSNLVQVKQQMESLEDLVEDLMSLAKADLAENSRELVDLHDIVATISERQRAYFDESGVKFLASLHENTELICERVRLVQVLENLFSNSCKYADASKADSWLKISSTVKPGKIVIVIEDNGVGIPEIHRAEVFTRFTRFHPNLGSGSGLGLSIVKKHIDKMHGEIQCNHTDQGTQFVILLPSIE